MIHFHFFYPFANELVSIFCPKLDDLHQKQLVKYSWPYQYVPQLHPKSLKGNTILRPEFLQIQYAFHILEHVDSNDLIWGFWGKSNPLKNDQLEIDLFKIESRNYRSVKSRPIT